MIQPGIRNEQVMKIENENTAVVMGSGDLAVLATPAMIALMEGCAAKSVVNQLETDETTVGTKIEVEHLAPSPVGMEIRCISLLEAAEGRRLLFSLEVYDACGLIGRGRHERYIVKSAPFLDKTYARQKK